MTISNATPVIREVHCMAAASGERSSDGSVTGTSRPVESGKPRQSYRWPCGLSIRTADKGGQIGGWRAGAECHILYMRSCRNASLFGNPDSCGAAGLVPAARFGRRPPLPNSCKNRDLLDNWRGNATHALAPQHPIQQDVRAVTRTQFRSSHALRNAASTPIQRGISGSSD